VFLNLKKVIMKRIIFSILSILFCVGTLNAQKKQSQKIETIIEKPVVIKDTLKNIVQIDSTAIDTITIWKIYKPTARASYYAEKFNGRRTASGKIFNMNKLSVAHKKLPFGTMLKVTNTNNNKSVIVEVTDRGPFVKSREIDLSKKAFMDIADNKGSGLMTVKIEITNNLKTASKIDTKIKI
jgi:rare lipoprotein A